MVLTGCFQPDRLIQKEGMMPQYDIFVFCNECGKVHPMGIQIGLKDGPTEKTSFGEFYSGMELPAEVLSLISNWIVCPETGNKYQQKDNNQVFLVPK